MNLLTPEVKLAAAQEVKLGKSIQLDLRLDYFATGMVGRERFEQEIVDFQTRMKDNPDYCIVGHDDIIKLNTQSSSQWDGLRHIGFQDSALYYNGVPHDDIVGKRSARLGIHSELQDVPTKLL